MDPIIDAPSGDDRDFRPEPRDLMVVVQDYIKLHGIHSEEEGPGGIETLVWKLDVPHKGRDLEYRIQGEYDDILIERLWYPTGTRQVILQAEDNTFTGVRFMKGDIQELEKVYLLIKPLVEAEGGTF